MEPPAGSALAGSLARGRFRDRFRPDVAVLGRGSSGEVLRAHLREPGPDGVPSVAVKLVPLRGPADRAAGEGGGWPGWDVFHRLQKLRSPHVVRYVDAWAELPEDVPLGEGEVGEVLEVLQPNAAKASKRVTSINAFPSVASFASFVDDGFTWEPRSTKTESAEDLRSSVSGAPVDVPYVLVVEMELCDGVTLANWRGSEDAALSILRQLATGLAALHASGVVHRDISPHNALVRSDGHAQLCDLGLARVQDAAPARALPASVPAARRLGTPGYAPAEHAGKEAARTSPAADVFALGVLLVEVLVQAQGAWRTHMERAKALDCLNVGALPPRLHSWDAHLRILISGMVALRPAARPTAAEVCRELHRIEAQRARRNPFSGFLAPSRVLGARTGAMETGPSTVNSPHVGFFIQHTVAAAPFCLPPARRISKLAPAVV